MRQPAPVARRGRRQGETRMRQIGTIPDERPARALADYLLTQRIETRLERQAGGWEVWVCDEDQVARAREELSAFTANPADPRFAAAGPTAEDIRRSEQRADATYRRRQTDLGDRLRRPSVRLRPVSAALIAISVGVAFGTNMGEKSDSEVMQALYIAPFTEFSEA